MLRDFGRLTGTGAYPRHPGSTGPGAHRGSPGRAGAPTGRRRGRPGGGRRSVDGECSAVMPHVPRRRAGRGHRRGRGGAEPWSTVPSRHRHGDRRARRPDARGVVGRHVVGVRSRRHVGVLVRRHHRAGPTRPRDLLAVTEHVVTQGARHVGPGDGHRGPAHRRRDVRRRPRRCPSSPWLRWAAVVVTVVAVGGFVVVVVRRRLRRRSRWTGFVVVVVDFGAVVVVVGGARRRGRGRRRRCSRRSRRSPP